MPEAETSLSKANVETRLALSFLSIDFLPTLTDAPRVLYVAPLTDCHAPRTATQPSRLAR
jgi:hypothetical protein